MSSSYLSFLEFDSLFAKSVSPKRTFRIEFFYGNTDPVRIGLFVEWQIVHL